MSDHTGPYVREAGDRLSFGNEMVEFGFSRSKNGALVSIIDKETGCELRRIQEVPTFLWKLALRTQNRKECTCITSEQAAVVAR